MRILFVNPPILREGIFGKSLRNLGALLPPLGLAYIAATVKRDGHEVSIIDGPVLSTKQDYDFNSLKKDITDYQPDIVAVTATSPQIKNAIKVFNITKGINENIITMLGGPHISALPQDLLKLRNLDYGVYGEGEFVVAEIIKRLENKECLEGLSGLIWREGDSVKYLPGEYINDLDILPFPARDLLPMKLYKPSPANYRRLPATQIFTSRGCPHSCVFCHKPIFGNKFRAHSVERVLDEIELLIKNFGIKDIQIFDDTFSMNKERAKGICTGIINRKLDIIWNCMTRIDTVDHDLLKLMRKAGCYGIGYGVESGSERILKLIKKKISKDMVRKVFRWTRNEGIEIRAFFMIGFPTETKEDILKTISFAKEINPDIAQFLVTTPYPGTELWHLCKKYGEINVGDWSDFTMYSSDSAPFVPFSLEKGELEYLYSKAMKNFYLRPEYILKQLLAIRSLYGVQRKYIAAKSLASLKVKELKDRCSNLFRA